MKDDCYSDLDNFWALTVKKLARPTARTYHRWVTYSLVDLGISDNCFIQVTLYAAWADIEALHRHFPEPRAPRTTTVGSTFERHLHAPSATTTGAVTRSMSINPYFLTIERKADIPILLTD